MENRKVRYIGVALLILLILLWAKKDDISILLNPGPSAESLQFAKQETVSDLRPRVESVQFIQEETTTGNRPVVISSDEDINISVFEKVHASVVNIATITLSVNFWMEVTPSQGQGTGFIIDKRGYILTNNHVVENARDITVTLASGKKMSATLVGRDSASDLAVIKISDVSVNEVAEFGNSNALQVGQKALAIGNPFGLGQTLTTGVISALNRSIMTEENIQIDDVIQTDAPINPGNSGGPLLNSSGEVIGINTSIFTLSGGYQGIGFAIPINRAKEIATQLITTGKVARPWLGIASAIPVTELSAYLDFGIDYGLLIVQVYQGGPANQAGLIGGDRMVRIGFYRLLIGGDIITAIDNIIISEKSDIDRVLKNRKIGDTVMVKMLRDRRFYEIPVTLTEKPQSTGI